MLKIVEHRILCVLGAASVLFVAVNIWLFMSNRSASASVNARTQYIQQTTPIHDLYQEMAKALAELSIKNHDDQVRTMLSGEGFTINQTPAKAAPAPAPAPRGRQ